MKKKLDINKEELWGKIVQDERMPQIKRKATSKRTYILSLLFLLLLCSGIGFLVFNALESSKEEEIVNSVENNYAQTRIRDKELVDIKEEEQIENNVTSEKNLYKDLKSNGNQKSSYHIEASIDVESRIASKNISKKEGSEEIEEQGRVERGSINKENLFSISKKPSQEIKNKLTSSQNLDVLINRNKLSKKDSSALDENELKLLHRDLEDKHANQSTFGNDTSILPNRNQLLRSESIEEVIIDERSVGILEKEENSIKNNASQYEFKSSNNVEFQSRVELDALPITPIKLLSIEDQTYDLQLSPIVKLDPFNANKLSFFFSLNYGTGSRSSMDSLGEDLGTDSPFEKRMKTYQFELGLSKRIASWGGRIGVGIDLAEGQGLWTMADTVYNVIQAQGRSTFERIENTTDQILHQRYGNIYLLSSINYHFQSGSWSIVPRMGVKYNIYDLTNGSRMIDVNKGRVDLNILGTRQQIAYSFALEIHRKLTEPFDLVLGIKYETRTTYQLSSNLSQSVSPLYLTLGGEYGF